MTVLLNKTLRRKIAAGASEHFVSEGRYLYLESAAPAVTSTGLLLTVDDVVQGFIAPGVGYETEPDQQFSTFRVENTTGMDVTVLVIVGFGRIIDNRFVASGTVAVQGVAGGTAVAVEAARATVPAFYGALKTSPAANVPVVGVQNPAASGKNLILNEISFGSTAAQDPVIGIMTGLLSAGLVVSVTATPGRKNLASAALVGVGVTGHDTFANVNALTTEDEFLHRIFANITYKLPYTEPFVIAPNESLLLWVQNVAVTLWGHFNWREVPV